MIPHRLWLLKGEEVEDEAGPARLTQGMTEVMISAAGGAASLEGSMDEGIHEVPAGWFSIGSAISGAGIQKITDVPRWIRAVGGVGGASEVILTGVEYP